jgi:hypothetical protein
LQVINIIIIFLKKAKFFGRFNHQFCHKEKY